MAEQVQIRTLRVSADMDASRYEAGAAKIATSGKTAAQANAELVQSFTTVDRAINLNERGFVSLERQFVEGVKGARDFAARLERLSGVIDRNGFDASRVSGILDGMYKKYGLMADAAGFAAKGQTELANAINAANLRFIEQQSSATKAATAATSAAGGMARRPVAANQNVMGGENAYIYRNIAQQVNQIGQMGAVTGQWMQAITVQLPDILGAFGSLPLVLAGGATAIAASMLSASGALDGLFKSSSAVNLSLREQNDIITNVAKQYGDATPLIKQYADALDQAKASKDRQSAAEIVSQRTLAPAVDLIQELRPSWSRMLADMPRDTIQAGNDHLLPMKQAIADLNVKLKEGTATTSDLTRAQKEVAEVTGNSGAKSVKLFADQWSSLNDILSTYLNNAAKVRSEGVFHPGMFRSYNSYLGVDRSADGTIQGETNPTPEIGPVPEGRPRIELEGLPGQQKKEESAAEKARKAYAELVKGARDRIEQMQLETRTAGETGIAAQKLAFELDLLQKAQDNGRKLTEDHRKEIEKLADAFETAATASAKVKLNADLKWETDQLYRSSQDQQIAARLRGAGLPVNVMSQEAGQIRSIMSQQSMKSDLTDFFDNFRSNLIANGGKFGESFVDAFRNAALKKLADIGSQAMDKIINLLVAGFTGGGTGGVSGVIGQSLGWLPYAGTQTASSLNGSIGFTGATTTMGSLLGAGVASNSSQTAGFRTIGSAMSFVGNYKGAGVDPRLTDILNLAAQQTPGFKVDAISGFRAGDPRFHGKGLATDVQLTDIASGKLLGNYQDVSSFASYEKFAQTARSVQMAKYPELADQFRWGGYFGGGKGKYGALDTMHFDLGGKGMAGGSWESGLTSTQMSLWAGAQSKGANAITKLSDAASGATKNLTSFGSDLTDLGKSMLGGGGSGAGAFSNLFSANFKPNTTLSDVIGYSGGQSSGGGLFGSLLGGVGKIFGGLFGGIGKIFGFADGTESSPGGIAMVGERGRELVNLPRGSQVIPNHRTEAILSGSAGNDNSSSQSGGVMQVVIQGASGDDHVRTLVQQGVESALSAQRIADRRGGSGAAYERWKIQKG